MLFPKGLPDGRCRPWIVLILVPIARSFARNPSSVRRRHSTETHRYGTHFPALAGACGRRDRPSPLPLLVPGVGADHEDDATAPDDLALFTHPTDAGADLHGRTRDDGRGGLKPGRGLRTEPQTIRSGRGGHKGVVRFSRTGEFPRRLPVIRRRFFSSPPPPARAVPPRPAGPSGPWGLPR